ncbi:hypothetical protein NQF87_01205 [Bombella sp. TMW 2.2559]|uniref:Uncharacterized protein n=1 Tax=Bombella dulcis TaxID=2967339 RepID=A0ABT3WCT6_9PROT|nr:hypothetical protein [Bombella dulcis]MCX5615602.1 hypothetical protein [Bombella dulcis]
MEIISSNNFTKFITSLSDDIFWNNYSQRDLLTTIEKRWQTLSLPSRNKIEMKILKGPRQESWETRKAFAKRRAWRILERLLWLQKSGCVLSPSTCEQIQRLRLIVPDWHDGRAKDAIVPQGSRSGTVTVNTDYNVLMYIPLSDVLQRAEQARNQSDDFLIKYEPFIGLIEHYPVRAFTALTRAAKKGDFPLWAWQQFLTSKIWNSTNHTQKQGRLFHTIAKRLTSYDDKKFADLLNFSSNFLYYFSKILTKKYISTFENLVNKSIKNLYINPNIEHSSNAHTCDASDWVITTMFSPSGLIAHSLFNDPRKENLLPNEGLPPEWLKNISSLLFRHSSFQKTILTVLFLHIDWFFSIDPKWTIENLLPLFKDSNENTCCAAWSGFLHDADTPHQELFLQIKEDLLQFTNPPLIHAAPILELLRPYSWQDGGPKITLKIKASFLMQK